MTAMFESVRLPADRPLELPAITITVYGLPGPQGSKHATLHKTTGRIVVMESSKKVKPWRRCVAAAATLAINDLPDWALLDGPLAASMTFTFLRPKGHYGTGRNAGVVKDSAPPRPAVFPDLSKLVRSTEDALTKLVWVDDSRVVKLSAEKRYASEGLDALDSPGAVIRIWRIGVTR